ncbi:hypothetical protein P389DRAFT_189016 [Cystobasidium minutum MCA 4210]|uniref:uncharacterized protein n=1 Tax=Cystobasidium minutum MCA 4210 TaxID=1397322 RepID=UPI0034CD6CB3|eukprot:jgi/Rhomi1/189016/estExt_fgenesh1_pg.C_3_t10450
MSSMFGRPANSGTTPTLGTPQQRSQASAMKQVQVSHRQRQIFSMLAGGVSNRLLLSIRSGLPKEIDYALELFLQYSYTDAASIPLDVLPGLPTALLDIVRPSAAKDDETLRRRKEAALILRNFILDGGQRSIESVRPYVEYIYEVLVQVLEEAESANNTTELVLYMLDMAEVYASTCTLLLPPEVDVPLAKQIPAQKLYTLLARLGQSNDRALIIGSYTLLSGLAMNKNNNPIFAYRAFVPATNEVSPQCPSTMLLEKAISLLPLNDAELLLPILEFLYQHTSIPSNSLRLLQNANMKQVIRSVIFHLREGAKEETVEYDVIQGSSSSSTMKQQPQGQNYRGKAMREALIAAYPSLDNKEKEVPRPTYTPEERAAFQPIMPEAALQSILYKPEPQRAYEWMKTVFEADPDGEITQVSLWQAYQKQFERYDGEMKAGRIPGMMNAADVIKGTQEAFTTASPKQTEDYAGNKRFVISGIRVAPPPPVLPTPAEKEREMWRCKWRDCPFAQSGPFDNAAALYEHLESVHVDPAASTENAQICQIDGCGQLCDTPRKMRYHLRTHIPSRVPLPASAPPTLAHAADALDRMTTFFTENRQIPQTVHGEYAAGVGFVSSLVVRNCARATVSAAQKYRRSSGASTSLNGNHDDNTAARTKNAALDNEEDDVERRKMFGFLTGSTTDDNTEDKDALDTANSGSDISLTAEQVKNAVNALANVESEILAVNAANKALAAYLTETLLCIEDAKKAVDGVL